MASLSEVPGSEVPGQVSLNIDYRVFVNWINEEALEARVISTARCLLESHQVLLFGKEQ